MTNLEMMGQCVRNAVPKQPNRSPIATCDVRSGKYTLEKKGEGCVCKEGHEKVNSKCQGKIIIMIIFNELKFPTRGI